MLNSRTNILELNRTVKLVLSSLWLVRVILRAVNFRLVGLP